MRQFERVSKYPNVTIPTRKTEDSAGYDLEAAEDVYIYPGHVKQVPTGIKVQMEPDNFLQLSIRSSLGAKGLIMCNSPGIIDADYYNNPENEGHVLIIVGNIGKLPVQIRKGERIAQGVFQPYLTADEEVKPSRKRKGGVGSTDEQT